jgi:hypothetical protein
MQRAFASNEISRLGHMRERRESHFRDYAYVSARKVVRMSRTLEPSAWSRVRDLEVKLGPVGATLNFDAGARAEDVIVLVSEVERAIRQRFGVHELPDPQLRVGQWFQVMGIPMVYGVPYGVLGGVLFLGPPGLADPISQPGVTARPGPARRRFALGGSSEYLLDRGGAADRPPGAGSVPRSIVDMLRALVGESLSDEDPSAGRFAAFDPINFDLLATRLGQGGQPMTALARCLDIVTSVNPPVVIGTPLYVAFHTPE